MLEEGGHVIRVLTRVQQEHDRLGRLFTDSARVCVAEEIRGDYLRDGLNLLEEAGAETLREVLDDLHGVDLVLQRVSVHGDLALALHALDFHSHGCLALVFLPRS